MDDGTCVTACEMHTGGMPVRIIESGLPKVEGDTILAKQRYFRENMDHFRKFLMWEPRGHSGMYGAALVPPSHPEAHLGVIFMDCGGFSTMCGHATIAVARYAVDRGYAGGDISDDKENTKNQEILVNVECPCGLVKAYVTDRPGTALHGAVRFQSVPAFLYLADFRLPVEEFGELVVDVSYGGNFYVLIEASRIGVHIGETPLTEVVRKCNSIAAAARGEIDFIHPDPSQSAALQYLYGVIVTDTTQLADKRETKNICVFAKSQVDRSPCGSGVTSRMAALHAKGEVGLGQSIRFISGITGAVFEAQIISETSCGGKRPAVIVEVKGQAFYSGSAKFIFENSDSLAAGFITG